MSKVTKTPHIRDVMSPVPVALNTERTLDEAEIYLKEFKVVSAPVVTAKGALVGALTDFQLLKCLLKRRQVTPQAHVLGNYLTELEGAQQVGDYEPVSEGFKKMIASPSRRVFVVDKNNKLVGCLEPANLFAFMSGCADDEQKPIKRRRLNSDGQDIPPSEEEVIFYEMPLPCCEFNLKGVVTYANFAFHHLLGHENHTLTGKTFKDVYGHKHHEEFAEHFEEIKTLEFKIPPTLSLVKKDQTLIKMNLICAVRRGEGAAVTGMMICALAPEQEEQKKSLQSYFQARYSILKK